MEGGQKKAKQHTVQPEITTLIGYQRVSLNSLKPICELGSKPFATCNLIYRGSHVNLVVWQERLVGFVGI